MFLPQETLVNAMRLAIRSAEAFVGATSPNPAVGAVAVDAEGKILASAAHEKAGSPHAEAKLLAELGQQNLLQQVHTLLVTLEPCNHQGRTGPCTEAILQAGIRRLVYACADPNPQVVGSGAAFLRSNGVQVEAGLLADEAAPLIRPFRKLCSQQRPWVVVKQALNRQGSMIPPSGQKTFSTPESLRYAHELRRRADAILTGSGTVLADQPLLNVRHVPDFLHKRRWLLVLDRRGRVSQDWIRRQESLGFRVLSSPHPALQDFGKLLDFLGKQACLELLVEAGPTLTVAFLESGLWDEHVVIQQQQTGDSIEVRVNRVHGNY